MFWAKIWITLTLLLPFCIFASAKQTGECYQDVPNIRRRFFKYEAYRNDPQNTVNKCIKACKKMRKRYAGLENGVNCFCDNSRRRYPRRPQAECNVKCTGSSEICGGKLRISVYTVGIYYNYREVIEKSILFYEAQRSGKLPANNRIKWRRDSALHDHGNNGEDLSGGWYTSGSHSKNNFISASATTVLSWGLLQFWDTYKDSGQLDWMLQSIKWPLKYLLKSLTSTDPINYEFYVAVANNTEENEKWQRAADIPCCRPAFKIENSKPGSDAAAEAAAALAAGSIVFKEEDACFSGQLLQGAKDLFNFAYHHRGRYSDVISVVKESWPSTRAEDEIVWGAAWMYLATKNEYYLEIAEEEYNSSLPWAFDWDDKEAGYMLLLYKITGKYKYENDLYYYAKNWQGGRHADIPYTPKGLAYRGDWGPLRYSANTAFLALVAADLGLKTDKYIEFAEDQIHYMLGDTGRSFVVGFGENPPVQPHHAGASCSPDIRVPCGWSQFSSPDPNPNVLYGALVGGPDIKDKYTDLRSDYKQNEVTVEYNAGFQSAVAGLLKFSTPGDPKRDKWNYF